MQKKGESNEENNKKKNVKRVKSSQWVEGLNEVQVEKSYCENNRNEEWNWKR